MRTSIPNLLKRFGVCPSEHRTPAYVLRVRTYSEYILSPLKQKIIKNGTSNVLKSNATVCKSKL